jgi:transcriptional regulator with XRE-family HTH domain
MSNANERLRDYFKSKGITQEQIAEDLSVTQSYVSSILRGNTGIGVRVAKKFAEKYNLSIEWILTGHEGEGSKNDALDVNYLEIISSKDALIAEKDARIQDKEEIIKGLREQIALLKNNKFQETTR